MKKTILFLIAISLFTGVEARDPLLLGNDSWPPFIIRGSEQGTAEQLVCQALQRSGWGCSVRVTDWEDVLNEARIGAIDGIAAAWRSPDRETFLLFSEPYLTNRIVPVINNDQPVTVDSIADLSGLRVALVNEFAYGDEILAATAEFTVVESKTSASAIKSVRNGNADVALVDELVARDELYKSSNAQLVIYNSVLALRDLHFAVSRRHPLAAAIIDDFQRSYKLMLADGTVNDILNVDWLATDFGQSGQVDVVMRSGASLDKLSFPSNDGSIYALESSEYDVIRQRNPDSSRVNYQVEGKSYSSLQTALDNVFGKDTVCKHKNFTSQFDCTDLFKKR